VRLSFVRLSFGVLTLVVVVGYLAVMALGPATNYDTGLYHLGAIKYSAEFGSLFGLANLYPGFGYSTAEFPAAAFLQNFALGEQGFRALGGFITIALLVELLTRWLPLPSKGTARKPGDYVALVSIILFLIPMLWMVDFWITSPAQDFATGALAVASAGYFVNALMAYRAGDHREFHVDVRITIVLIGTTLLFRSTMVLWAVGMVIVVGILCWRMRRGSVWFLIVVGAVVAAVVSARDFVLSGWLQYPLSIAPLPVSWRAPDPTPLREATLGYHRDPSDLWGSVSGYDWVGPWFARLPDYWETYLFIVLAVAAVVLWLLGRKSASRNIPLGVLALALTPSVIAIAGWFLASPPSFRFAWGMWFSLWGILIGLALWRLPLQALRRSAVWAGAGSLVGVVIVATAVKFADTDLTQKVLTPAGITIAVAPFPQPDIEARTSSAGLEYLNPVTTDQCWDVYPLCTPSPAPELRFRGDGIEFGFESGPRGN
jgi:hypothetical protein